MAFSATVAEEVFAGIGFDGGGWDSIAAEKKCKPAAEKEFAKGGH
jgi:hypothetical protein